MAFTKDKIINDIKESIKRMNNKGIKVKKAYLFGSYVNGKPKEYSDIDVAIVSKNFKGIRFFDHVKIVESKVKTNEFIEIHPFRPEDFNKWNPFAREIIATGIKIV